MDGKVAIHIFFIFIGSCKPHRVLGRLLQYFDIDLWIIGICESLCWRDVPIITPFFKFDLPSAWYYPIKYSWDQPSFSGNINKTIYMQELFSSIYSYFILWALSFDAGVYILNTKYSMTKVLSNFSVYSSIDQEKVKERLIGHYSWLAWASL